MTTIERREILMDAAADLRILIEDLKFGTVEDTDEAMSCLEDALTILIDKGNELECAAADEWAEEQAFLNEEYERGALAC